MSLISVSWYNVVVGLGADSLASLKSDVSGHLYHALCSKVDFARHILIVGIALSEGVICELAKR